AEIAREVRPHRPGSATAFLARKGCVLPGATTDLESALGESWTRLPQVVRVHVAAMKANFLDMLAPRFPNAKFLTDPSRLEGLGYYQGPTLRIRVRPPNGEHMAIIDGGFTDWTQRILADRKERLLCSAIGTEAVCKLFRKAPDR